MFTYIAIMIFLIGVFGMLVKKNLIKMLLSLNIAATGVNLFLVSVGYEKGGVVPILHEGMKMHNLSFSDPLTQALVLTAIVIGLGTTALALTLIVRYYRKEGTLLLGGDDE